MESSVRYIVDESGRKTSVIVPFKQWESLNSRYNKLLAKIDVLTGIKDSLNEIKRAKENGEDLQSLDEFLNECGC